MAQKQQNKQSRLNPDDVLRVMLSTSLPKKKKKALRRKKT